MCPIGADVFLLSDTETFIKGLDTLFGTMMLSFEEDAKLFKATFSCEYTLTAKLYDGWAYTPLPLGAPLGRSGAES